MIQVATANEKQERQNARYEAVKFIGISKKSSGRVRSHLLNKGFSSQLCDLTVSELIDDRYIDDARVARSILNTRKGSKSEGRVRLRARLQERGIPDDVAEESLLDFPSDSETVIELLKSKFKSEGPVELDREDFRATITKTTRFLVSRGYSYDLVSHALINYFKQVE
ncbi:MAG: RecX family transcriptional regulator [Clostridiales bacterium]|nr:RecX family transcriptional regulator [Clostridiales bacterium]